MRWFLLPFLAVGFLIAFLTSVRADDQDARAVIARAVEVLGGEERLTRGAAIQTKMSGSVSDLPNGVTFDGDVWSQVGVGLKFSLHIGLPGIGRATVTQAIRDGKGWKNINGEISDLTDDDLAEARLATYFDGMPGLVHLLRDKTFTLTLQEESKIDGKPAAVILVRTKGKPDVTLFFDKESGLLVKQTYRQKDANSDTETLEEVLFSDYRLPNVVGEDEKRLKAAGIDPRPERIVAFLENRKADVVDAERVKKLIRQLGDDDFDVREQATEELFRVGHSAVPFLKEAQKGGDAEIVRRAEECLKRLGTSDVETRKNDAIAAAVRLVGVRKPNGATEALLNVLTVAADDAELRAEVYSALLAVAVKDGKPNTALQQALDGSDPKRRAAAEAVLGKDGGKWLAQPGRRLFLGDAKIPHKAVLFKDGKRYFEREILSQQYFNRFEDSVWVKPGSP